MKFTKQKQTQAPRTNLWVQGGGDNQGVWDGNVHTARFKIDEQQ